jgi:hypothetical protein
MREIQRLAAGPTELDRVYGLRPQYYSLFMEDYNRSIGRVDPVVVEMCRLRMATLLGSQLDLALRYKPAVEASRGARITQDRLPGRREEHSSEVNEQANAIGDAHERVQG